MPVAIDLFVRIAQACRTGTRMRPRSPNDKEYFAQDWFADRVLELGIPCQQQGRNSYPDFWVGEDAAQQGFEIKSLAFENGRPARKDIDFNSTIPSGKKAGRDCFLVFFLYTGTGSSERDVHTVSMAHADLINCDHALSDEHLNVSIHQFGSYADGFIRNRKMYVFPHPVTIHPEGLGRQRLIVPMAWTLRHPQLEKVAAISRTIAPEAVDRYTIRLHGKGEAEVGRAPSEKAGETLIFEVFELK